ncbi:hypothetical protein QYE76_028323 [Lolium multiflorum]|uniref:Pleiotropic ABC efflux transporter N-terminal domain-containing protein n=1 Tax=Lolium multiflorum TaxID=4521 RepID=A0AAD8QKR3_LOLMU|nr:hypothetical protein QYE76_028323 [Lolium multiflorum]
MEYRQEAEQPPVPPTMASERLASRPSLLTHEDNRHFLRMLREEKKRLGVPAAKVEVRFEELVVEADVRIDNRTLPTLFNCVVNAAQVRGKWNYGRTYQRMEIQQPPSL